MLQSRKILAWNRGSSIQTQLCQNVSRLERLRAERDLRDQRRGQTQHQVIDVGAAARICGSMQLATQPDNCIAARTDLPPLTAARG